MQEAASPRSRDGIGVHLCVCNGVDGNFARSVVDLGARLDEEARVVDVVHERAATRGVELGLLERCAIPRFGCFLFHVGVVVLIGVLLRAAGSAAAAASHHAEGGGERRALSRGRGRTPTSATVSKAG